VQKASFNSWRGPKTKSTLQCVYRRLILTVPIIACVICACHQAPAAWGLKFDVSTDGGATWRANVDATAGQVVMFRFGAYFDTTTIVSTPSGIGGAQAFSRFTGQNQVQNLGEGDVIQNVVRRTTDGNAALTVVNGNLIGTTSILSFGRILYLGLIPLYYYDVIYTGEIKISTSSQPHAMTLSNKQFGSGTVQGLSFYKNWLGPPDVGAPVDSPNHTDVLATINVIPSPASFALAAMSALLMMCRRQRVSCLCSGTN